MTQSQRILRHLEDFGSITSAEAMQDYGIMRLASRVNDLRKLGHPIISERGGRREQAGREVPLGAVQDGGENVSRLIDVDALLKSHCISLDGEYESCKECLEPPYGCCCLEVKGEDIDNAPTIDAIPIDWLDAQISGYASALKSTELKALMVVKGLWEKDQEEHCT